VEQTLATTDSDPNALACYGLLLRSRSVQGAPHEEVWRRFVEGRPVSAITTAFLAWSGHKRTDHGKRALLLIWDHASWPRSQAVRPWSHEHNHQVKRAKTGIRVVVGPWPIQSPWLTPLEPHWVHGKRGVVAADGILPAREVAERVCAYFRGAHEPHLAIPEKVV
jgi:hypothetical protein